AMIVVPFPFSAGGSPLTRPLIPTVAEASDIRPTLVRMCLSNKCAEMPSAGRAGVPQTLSRGRALAFISGLLRYILLPLPAVNPVFHGEFIRSKEFAPNTLAQGPRWCSRPPGPIAQRS